MIAHDVRLNGFLRQHGRYTVRVLFNEHDRVRVTDELGNRIHPLPLELSRVALALSVEVQIWRRGQTAAGRGP